MRRKATEGEQPSKAHAESQHGGLPFQNGKEPRSRSRSTSIPSSDSVSTISTSRSESPAAKRGRQRARDEYMTSQPAEFDLSCSPPGGPKRKRRSSSGRSSQSASPPRRADEHKMRRHRLKSPRNRGRHDSIRRGSHRSRSASLDKSQIAKSRKSLDSAADEETRTSSSQRHQPKDMDHHPTECHEFEGDSRAGDQHRHRPSRRKQRSLSPYSRRLALTQAMNMPH